MGFDTLSIEDMNKIKNGIQKFDNESLKMDAEFGETEIL